MQTAEKLANTEAAIWARVVRPKRVTLSRQLARFLLDLEFPEEEKARMHELAVKARAGTLTPEEEEIDSYGRIGSLSRFSNRKRGKH